MLTYPADAHVPCCNDTILLFSAFCLLQPLLALLLMQLHLVRRALETELLMHYPSGASMHGIAYVFGLRCVQHSHPMQWAASNCAVT
jgi:hypothetical protein